MCSLENRHILRSSGFGAYREYMQFPALYNEQ